MNHIPDWIASLSDGDRFLFPDGIKAHLYAGDIIVAPNIPTGTNAIGVLKRLDDINDEPAFLIQFDDSLSRVFSGLELIEYAEQITETN